MEYTFLSKNVEIKKIRETKFEGVFEITGLYTGYGVTLGNALRRVLLSSIPGAAITQVKIKGVKHEFSAIKDIAEDVVDIMLNLKKIRFKIFDDESHIVTLKKKGKSEVKAGDIKTTSELEVVNRDEHIATITSNSGELEMEMTVEKGLGYSSVESRKIGKLPIGTIALDAVFTPVLNVNFEIENMRVGNRTDYNKLVMTINTDSTISPSRALHKASNILADHLNIISSVEVKDDFEVENDKKKTSKK